MPVDPLGYPEHGISDLYLIVDPVASWIPREQLLCLCIGLSSLPLPSLWRYATHPAIWPGRLHEVNADVTFPIKALSALQSTSYESPPNRSCH